MVENINDFLSVALLIGFFLALILAGFGRLNKTRIRKHIEEEYYYYNDSDDLDEDQ